MFLLSILITGCSSNKNRLNLKNSISSSSNNISNTSVSSSTSSAQINISSENKPENNKNSVMEAYKRVLLNEIEFYSTENKKKVYLKDFLSNENIFEGVTIKINQFAVVDMDGDQIPEVILKLTVVEEPNFSEVLHYINGEVDGYFFGKNQLCDLKTDGTFRWLSGGLMYNGYGNLKFQNKSCESGKLAYLNSKYKDESYTTFTTSYYINNKQVTEDSYQIFVKEEDAKKDVEWYEFSQENISKMTSEINEKTR
jgi:hypothetical protein